MQKPSTVAIGLPTLEEVAQLFQDWRRTRTNAREAIPEQLWILVFSLMGRYQQSKICHRLGLTNQQLSSRQLKTASQSEATKPSSPLPSVSKNPLDLGVIEQPNSDTFIKVSLSPSPATYPVESDANQRKLENSTSQRSHSQVELIHPNGIVMRITLLADHHLSPLLSSFMGAT